FGSATTLYLGSLNGTSVFGGYIDRVAYWGDQLPNSSLVGLTLATPAPSWVLTAEGGPAVLDIDFVGDQAWTASADAQVTIASRLTCNRASAGFYQTAAGALQQFTSNQLYPSQEFESWNTSVNVTVTADATTAPDGTSTGDLITTTANGGNIYTGPF